MEKIYFSNTNQFILSIKIDFKAKFMKNKEIHYKILKDSANQEHKTELNMYAPSNSTSQCLNQKQDRRAGDTVQWYKQLPGMRGYEFDPWYPPPKKGQKTR